MVVTGAMVPPFDMEDENNTPGRTQPAWHVVGVCLMFSAIMGTIFLYHRAYLASTFPLLLLLPCAAALGTGLAGQHFKWLLYVLYAALLLCTLGLHWSLGGQYITVGAWALLAPQLAVVRGLRVGTWAALMGLGAACLVALHVLAAVLGPEALSPQPVALPPVWQYTLNTLNVLLPDLVCFAVLCLQSQQMRGALRRMRELAMKIIKLDVEDVTADSCHSEGVWLLQNLANFMKVYKAYLPSYLYSPAGSQGGISRSVSLRQLSAETLPVASAHVAGTHLEPDLTPITSAQIVPRHHAEPPAGSPDAPPPAAPEPCARRKPSATPELSVRKPPSTAPDLSVRRVATLAYIGLQGVEQLSAVPETVMEVSSTFLRIVDTVVRKHRGVMENVTPLSCLLSWNVVRPCASHAQAACLAALQIQEILQVPRHAMPSLYATARYRCSKP